MGVAELVESVRSNFFKVFGFSLLASETDSAESLQLEDIKVSIPQQKMSTEINLKTIAGSEIPVPGTVTAIDRIMTSTSTATRPDERVDVVQYACLRCREILFNHSDTVSHSASIFKVSRFFSFLFIN